MATSKTTTASRSQKGESVSENWDELSEQIERLRNDIGAVNAAVSGLAKASVSEGRDRVAAQIDDLAQRTREMTDQLNAKGRRLAEDAAGQASALSRDLEAAINRNPLTAILVALGLGFLIGLTSRGRG